MNWSIIGSDNSLAYVWHQAISWTNYDLSPNASLVTDLKFQSRNCFWRCFPLRVVLIGSHWVKLWQQLHHVKKLTLCNGCDIWVFQTLLGKNVIWYQIFVRERLLATRNINNSERTKQTKYMKTCLVLRIFVTYDISPKVIINSKSLFPKVWFICLIFNFCIEHSSDTVVLWVKFQNDLATETGVMDEPGFASLRSVSDGYQQPQLSSYPIIPTGFVIFTVSKSLFQYVRNGNQNSCLWRMVGDHGLYHTGARVTWTGFLFTAGAPFY